MVGDGDKYPSPCSSLIWSVCLVCSRCHPDYRTMSMFITYRRRRRSCSHTNVMACCFWTKYMSISKPLLMEDQFQAWLLIAPVTRLVQTFMICSLLSANKEVVATVPVKSLIKHLSVCEIGRLRCAMHILSLWQSCILLTSTKYSCRLPIGTGK